MHSSKWYNLWEHPLSSCLYRRRTSVSRLNKVPETTTAAARSESRCYLRRSLGADWGHFQPQSASVRALHRKQEVVLLSCVQRWLVGDKRWETFHPHSWHFSKTSSQEGNFGFGVKNMSMSSDKVRSMNALCWMLRQIHAVNKTKKI